MSDRDRAIEPYAMLALLLGVGVLLGLFLRSVLAFLNAL